MKELYQKIINWFNKEEILQKQVEEQERIIAKQYENLSKKDNTIAELKQRMNELELQNKKLKERIAKKENK